jgi:hypothetical protein
MSAYLDDMYSTCLVCGSKYGTTPLYGIGVWPGVCSICGKKDVPCAATVHDFHIHARQQMEAIEKEQGRTFPEPDGKDGQ